MATRDVVDFKVGHEGEPERMLRTLAAYYGIGREVAELLDRKGTKAPDLHRGGLANVLNVQRTVKGMTIAQVHERCGISTSQVGYYEAHQVKNPGIRTLQAIAHGYHLPFALVLVSALHDVNPHMKSRL